MVLSFRRYKYKNKKGLILITTLLLVLVIAVLTTSLFARTISERRQITMESNRIISFNLAESGLDQTLKNLATNPGYTGTDMAVSLGGGEYAIQVTQPDVMNNPNVRQITSTGYTPSNQQNSYAYQELTITAFVTITSKAKFSTAIFAEDTISISENVQIDSYDSEEGDYDPDYAGDNGDVGTNATSDDSVVLEDDVVINGDLFVGPGGDPNQVIDAEEDVIITGEQSAALLYQNYPPVSVPEGLISSGDLDLSGSESLELGTGIYLFDSINVSGQAQLNVTGPVIIYTTGDVKVTGQGIDNPGKTPANFMVNVVGDRRVHIGGNGIIYASVYSPESKRVRMNGNVHLYGAIISHDFEAVGNAQVHYDAALETVFGSDELEIELISWQEA